MLLRTSYTLLHTLITSHKKIPLYTSLMHKLHFSPKCISYTPLFYGMRYTNILAYVTPPQGIGVTPSWIWPPCSSYIFVPLILTWHTYLCLWKENSNLINRELESLEEDWERERNRVLKSKRRSWRAKVIQCLHQLLLSKIFFRFGWTSSFFHCTLYLYRTIDF